MSATLHRRVLVAIAVAVAVASPRASRADGATDPAAAEQLFKEARALIAEKKYDQACPKLEASQRLDPGAGTLLNLAGCYEGLGRTASAWVTYRDAEGAADRSGRADWSRSAHEHAETLSKSLSRLTITVPSAAAASGLVVERDGKPVDAALWGTAVPTDPGSHVVGAHAPGKKSWTTRIDVAPKGANVMVSVPPLATDVAAAPSPSPSPSATAEPEEKPSARRTVGLVIGGVGLGVVAAGAVFGLLANGTYHDAIDGDCGGRADRCSSRGVDRIDSAHTEAAVSTVLFSVGAAALVTGAILFFTAPRRRDFAAQLAGGRF